MSKQAITKICRHNDDLVAGAAFRDGEGKFITERYLEKTELPTEVSSFNNDAGYLTEHQSLENYATKGELDKNKMI